MGGNGRLGTPLAYRYRRCAISGRFADQRCSENGEVCGCAIRPRPCWSTAPSDLAFPSKGTTTVSFPCDGKAHVYSVWPGGDQNLKKSHTVTAEKKHQK